MAYNIYLTDEDGFYILNDEGDRIIVGIGAGFDLSDVALLQWRRLGGVARRDIKFVQSFSITRGYDDRWRLMVNQHQLVGFYPGQQEAIAVLIGLMTRNNGGSDSERVEATINAMLAKGSSSKIESADNVLALERAGDDYVSTWEERVLETVSPQDGTLKVAIQYSDVQGVFASSGTEVELAGVLTLAEGTDLGDNTYEYTHAGAYDSQIEDRYARAVVVDVSGGLYEVTNVIGSPTVLKDELGALTVVLTDNAAAANPAQRLICAIDNYNEDDHQILQAILQQEINGVWTDVVAKGVATGASSDNVVYTQAEFDSVTEHNYYRVRFVGLDIVNSALVTTEISLSNVLLKDDVPDTIVLDMTIDEPVELNGFANANTTVSGLPEGVTADLTYDWQREIPSLTGLSVTTTGN